MEGVEIDNLATGNHLLMNKDEKRVLELYDRLEELQLDIALLKAQGVLSQGEFNPPHHSHVLISVDESMEGPQDDEEVERARDDLLKAKARYQVRNNIIQSVLIANPILKAVHSGENASIIEQ